MLQLSSMQLSALDRAASYSYVDSVLSTEFPLVYRSLKNDLRQELVKTVSRKIKQYRLRTKYAQQSFIRLSVLFGSRFDEDLVIREPMDILVKSNEPCVLRAIKLRDWALSVREDVYGASYEHYRDALHRVEKISYEFVVAARTADQIIAYGNALFPTKSEWLGEEREVAILEHCRQHLQCEYRQHQQDLPLLPVIYGCCFFLGSSTLDDPLHDFVRNVLRSNDAPASRVLFEYLNRRIRSELRSLKIEQ